jgi:dephospho-CoA kinase
VAPRVKVKKRKSTLPEVDPDPSHSESSRAIGLTGGVASGKSTVAKRFESLGAYIIDADRIGHEQIEPGRPAYREILDHFGEGILASDGSIDRKKLGPIVFGDPKQLAALNAIIHPRIIARQDELAREHRDVNPRGVIIIDAALIFESGLGGNLRKVIVAWCRPEQQVERLMAKAGITSEDAQKRIHAQMPVEEKRRRADYQIDCSGTLDETYRQADAIYLELQRMAEAR